jgi:hypothetical protein
MFMTTMEVSIIWRVIIRGINFRGKSEKALRINFRGFKFYDSSLIQETQCGTVQTIMSSIRRTILLIHVAPLLFLSTLLNCDSKIHHKCP